MFDAPDRAHENAGPRYPVGTLGAFAGLQDHVMSVIQRAAACPSVIATGDLRDHAGRLVAWTSRAGLPLLVFPNDRQAALHAQLVQVSLVMLFQPAPSAEAVGTFQRIAPDAPVLHVSERQHHHAGVLWVSNTDANALIERAKQLLRAEPEPAHEGPFSIGSMVLDPERGSVWIEKQPVHLPRAQFRLLFLLSQNCGSVFERKALCSQILGTHGSPRRIDWHVARLRAALGPMARYVETWPTGYAMSRLPVFE